MATRNESATSSRMNYLPEAVALVSDDHSTFEKPVREFGFLHEEDSNEMEALGERLVQRKRELQAQIGTPEEVEQAGDEEDDEEVDEEEDDEEVEEEVEEESGGRPSAFRKSSRAPA